MTPFDSQEKIEIGFIYMSHSEPVVDFVIAGVFEDHSINDCLPSFQNMSIPDAIIDNRKDHLCYGGLFILELVIWRGLVGVWRGSIIGSFSV
jgi:hypothetical protein